jgi:hypothetical protein
VEYKNILITSTTRTGSTYINNFFCNNGISKGVDKDDIFLQLNKNNILQLCQHKDNDDINIESIPNSKKWHYILSSRKNKFDQICSEEIAFYTNQFKVYNYFEFKMELQLSTIISRYEKIIQTEKKWKEIALDNRFASFTEIFQEDLDKDDVILYNIAKKIGFDIVKTDKFKIVEKSPYVKQKVILNYQELKTDFENYLKLKNNV